MATHKKAAAIAAQRALIASQSSQASSDVKRADADQPMSDSGIDEDLAKKSTSTGDTTKYSQVVSQPNTDNSHTASTSGQPPIVPTSALASNDATPPQPRQPWEYVDEILNLMKTGHPLLVLTIETMVDQILQKFKASAEEEIYRLVCMLLVDAVQVIFCSSRYIIRLLMHRCPPELCRASCLSG